ncbi:S-layer homology domain-containing protein [Paenibacillus sp. MWE-103]|uniref:S-layer homology domain-containing protein n=1 Tax=Paenibacillus artemisiicola TaxID=1172618 RepID=A0ABS3WJ27_9BACL|nr:S-layer homology domain-containing protein [Paenibacillus artemisiicola]MBO7748305.1 S-layer homology domain-containing protein [Paenibacillus artemisiicola]
MPQQKKWVKLVSSFMVFSLLTSFTAAGAASVHADAAVATTKFSDVPAGHWAEKHIAKLASQGIVKGTNGAFKPNDNISQQEAVALAIRFIGKESDVQADEAVVFPENFNVSTYFKPYIILAFQQGLLNRDEEFKLADADPATAWGTKKASREWITKLLVKAIGKEEAAKGLATAPISFKDGNQVGADYAGYVNAAVQLQLIKGVTVDKFDPKGSITRAAIATMFSRAEAQYPVAYAGQFTAVLTGADSASLKLYQDGKETSVALGADTYVYRFDSEKAAALGQLQPNTNVLVVASGGKAVYVEQLDDKQQVENLTGTFDRLVTSESKLWMWVDDEPVAVNYSSATKVADGSGKVIPVTALTKDSNIVVARDTYRAKPIAVSITVQSAPVNTTGSGTVEAVQTTPPTVTIADGATKTTVMYSVSPQADVVWQGQILDGGLSQLRVGDAVSYEVKNSVVTKITITQTSSKVVRGEFYSASSDGSTIQYVMNAGTAQQSLEAKFVSPSADVSIDGLTGATISDLVKGDVLDITLNDNGQVSAIKVVNRKVNTLPGATVLSYDADLKALTVRDTSNNLVSVYLSDKTKLDMNGSTLQLSAATSLLAKGKKITLGYTENKAVFIQFVYKYTGTVTAINTNNNSITLLQNGVPVTVALDYPYYVEISGKTSATLSDVKAGDTVTALLNANQDKVSSLQVQTAKQVEVYSVDLVGKRVKFKNADGTVTDYAASALTLTNEKGDSLALGSLAAGQVGNLYFMGQTVSSFKALNVTVGRVASVAADKLTVTDYNGNTVTVPLGSAYTVVKNGATGSSASVLTAGDRVEVKLDAKDRLSIAVNSGIAKKFWKYDASARVLSVKRENLTDAYTYAVPASAKVTQNGAAISLSQLADGDAIVLYFYRDTLVEIAKV